MMHLAKSPGKLILAGEHSVLHGAQAIAVAVNRHTKVTITETDSTSVSIPSLDISFIALDALTDHQLHPIKQAIEMLMNHSQSLTNVHIHIDSNLPFGAGMGSSASVFSSLCLAWSHHFQLDCELMTIVYALEQSTHHRASQVDAHTVMHGGAWLFSQNNPSKRLSCDLDGWYWFNTGQPQSSTSECVSHTLPLLQHHPEWVEAMNKASLDLSSSLQISDCQGIHKAIRTLHQHLVKLGVVSQSSQQQIHSLEQQGMSAKISGAGTLNGEQSGIMIIYSPDKKPTNPEFHPLHLDQEGTHTWSK